MSILSLLLNKTLRSLCLCGAPLFRRRTQSTARQREYLYPAWVKIFCPHPVANATPLYPYGHYSLSLGEGLVITAIPHELLFLMHQLKQPVGAERNL